MPPEIRREDVFYMDDGWQNLRARLFHLAIIDARRIAGGEQMPTYATEERLMEWLFSDWWHIHAKAVGIDPDAFESRILELIDGDEP